jgi:hypothetical protein
MTTFLPAGAQRILQVLTATLLAVSLSACVTSAIAPYIPPQGAAEQLAVVHGDDMATTNEPPRSPSTFTQFTQVGKVGPKLKLFRIDGKKTGWPPGGSFYVTAGVHELGFRQDRRGVGTWAYGSFVTLVPTHPLLCTLRLDAKPGHQYALDATEFSYPQHWFIMRERWFIMRDYLAGSLVGEEKVLAECKQLLPDGNLREFSEN